MYFDQIMLVGSGRISCDCAQILYEKGISFQVMESQVSPISMLRKQCVKRKIPYLCCEKNELLENICANLKYFEGGG